ncbi:hypothetical protein CB1_000185006 [Camelus ferus]|nr:hypothetical protein CB1_000185006 [Camelus ferus]
MSGRQAAAPPLHPALCRWPRLFCPVTEDPDWLIPPPGPPETTVLRDRGLPRSPADTSLRLRTRSTAGSLQPGLFRMDCISQKPPESLQPRSWVLFRWPSSCGPYVPLGVCRRSRR